MFTSTATTSSAGGAKAWWSRFTSANASTVSISSSWIDVGGVYNDSADSQELPASPSWVDVAAEYFGPGSKPIAATEISFPGTYDDPGDESFCSADNYPEEFLQRRREVRLAPPLSTLLPSAPAKKSGHKLLKPFNKLVSKVRITKSSKENVASL